MKKLKYFSIIFIICSLFLFSGCNLYDIYKSTLKIDKISSVDCELKSKTNFWLIKYSNITITNNSLDWISYKIVSGANSSTDLYRASHFWTCNWSNSNQQIEYNVGKVDINIQFSIQYYNGEYIKINKSFTGYTKGENNLITFYSNPNCTKELNFEIETSNNIFYISLDIHTTYMD